MLNKRELGHAIETAIERKIESGAIQSISDVARHFGVKAPSVHGWIKTGAISKDKLPELWRYFADVVGPEHWGLAEWPAALPEAPGSESARIDANVSPAAPPRGRIPVISEVQAGHFTEVVDNYHPGDADEWLEVSCPVNRHTFALIVTGDSMEPEFPSGVRVVVEPDLQWENGDYVVAGNGESATLKQIVRDGNDWYLKPLNPRYPIKPLGKGRVIGVVREAHRKYR